MELSDRVHMQELDEGVVRVGKKLEKSDPYYRRCIRKKFPFGEFDGYVEMVQESLETCEKLYLVKYLSGEKEHLSLANVKKWALKDYAPEAKKKPHRSNAELDGTLAMKKEPASKDSKTGEADGTVTRSAAAIRTAAWRAKKKAEAAAAGVATPSRTRAMKDGERRPKVRKTVTKGQDKPRKVKKVKKEGDKAEKSDNKSEQPMKHRKKAPVEGSGKKDAMKAKTGTTTKPKKHPGRPPCNITGCGKYSQGKKQYEDDAHGPAGYRCHRHRAIVATT